MTALVTAYVGLGGNLGDVAQTVRRALAALDAIPGTRVIDRSRLYRTPAWGPIEQPDFINAVAIVDTALGPHGLLAELLRIERAFGRDRERESARWGPRTLDLDLLLHGDAVVDDEGLHLPHPRMHERAFVLVPLLDVAPALEIPGQGSARDALAALATGGIEALP